MSTEVIPIFSSRSISKNASTVLATPISLGKFGPGAMFAGDLTASGGGTVTVDYQVGNTPGDTFFRPSSATPVFKGFKSSVRSASRDRALFEPELTPWMKFKAKEANASPVVIDFNLIVST